MEDWQKDFNNLKAIVDQILQRQQDEWDREERVSYIPFLLILKGDYLLKFYLLF